MQLHKIQVRRRPNLNVVRSLRYPANGSEMASQIRDKLKIAPITAGAMSKTSVENFITYKLRIKYM